MQESKSREVLALVVCLLIVLVESGVAFNSSLLPNLSGDFEVSNTVLQLTISCCLISLGFAGIIYGGISAFLGRRKLILIGIALFTLGTILGTTEKSISILFLGRILQGIGAGVGWIIGNASIKDVFHGKEYVRVMNQLHVVAGIVPAVAPVLGSFIATSFGWRTTFYTLAFLSSSIWIFAFFNLPESSLERKPFSLRVFFDQYKKVFSSQQTIFFTIAKVFAVTLLFADSANLPLIYVEAHGLSSNAYSGYLALLFLSYMLGSLISLKLASKHPLEKSLPYGIFFLVCSGAGSLLLHSFGIYNLPWIHIPKIFGFLGFGFLFGNLTSAVVTSAATAAAAAAAVMIASEMLVSGVVILILSKFYNATLIPLALYTLVAAAIVSFALAKAKKT